MSIFSAVKRYMKPPANPNPLENPAVSLSSPAAWEWLTGNVITDSGELVTEVSALQSIAVYSCVRVIAESVASLPLRLFEHLDAGRKPATDSLLYDILSIEPNPEMSAFTFFETLTGCLALTGNAYAQIVRNQAGQVAALYPLHPLKTEPLRIDGNLVYRTTDGEGSGSRILKASEVLHVPLFCFDGLKGLSPIQQARQAIGLSRAAEKFGARFFGNGSRPGGVLSTEASLDDKQLALARDSWLAAQGGANQGKTAVLPGTWKYEQVGLSPEESQFLETRKFQRTDIAALFRVPPHMIGDTTRLSNSNHEQESLQFVTDTLRPYLRTGKVESRDLTVAADGVLIPTLVADPKIAKKFAGSIYDIVGKFKTDTGAPVKMPLLNDTAQGFVLASTGITTTDPSVAGVTISIDDYRSNPILIENSLIKDSGFDIAGFVNNAIVTRYLRTVSSAMTVGNASNVGGLTAITAGVQSATTAVLAYKDFVALMVALDPAYIADACWTMNNTTLGLILNLVDSNNRPLFLPYNDGATGRFVGQILGFPVKINPYLPNVATGNKAVQFGSFTEGYTFREVAPGIVVSRLSERYAELNKTGFVAFARVGGAVTDAGTSPIMSLTIK